MNHHSLSYVLDVGDEVPDFTLDSQLGTIRFRDAIDGKWCLLLTINKCFDPVNSTEIGALQKLIGEFTARNILLLIIGNDSIANYRKWIKEISEIESVSIEIPIISDPLSSILKQLGCVRELPSNNETRVISIGTFLIDMDQRIRTSMRYSVHAGRNMYECIRLFDALQTTTNYTVVCPVNWGHGQDVLVDNKVGSKEANKMFPKGIIEIKPGSDSRRIQKKINSYSLMEVASFAVL